MSLELAYYGDPILRKKGLPVEEITDEIKELVEQMIESMHANRGIGLAAPQVKKGLRLFITCFSNEESEDESHQSPVRVFINPVLTEPSLETEIESEGCLSIPGIYEEVERPKSITVEAMGLDGKIFKETLHGMEARVVMHENDHINGVLFVDRIDKKSRKALEKHLKDLKKKYS